MSLSRSFSSTISLKTQSGGIVGVDAKALTQFIDKKQNKSRIQTPTEKKIRWSPMPKLFYTIIELFLFIFSSP